MKRIIENIYFRLAVTLILLVVLYFQVDPNTFLILLAGIKWIYVILGFLVVIFGIFISSLKWDIILSSYGIKIPFYKIFSLYWAGGFFNLFLPTSFGGDFYKYYYIEKSGYDSKRGQIASSLLLERGLGLYSSIIFALLSFSFFGAGIHSIYRIVSFVIALAMFFVLFYVFRSNKKSIKSEKFTNEWLGKIKKVYRIFINFSNRKALLLSFIMSLLFAFLCVLAVYVSFLAVGYNVDIKILLYLVPIINLSTAIPISINSIGLKEEVGLLLYSIYSIASEIALSAMLISRIFNTIVSLIGGLFYLTLGKIKK